MNPNRLVVCFTLLCFSSCLRSVGRYEMAPAATVVADQDVAHNTESYSRIEDNPFLAARENPLSTFSIDVDTASYSNVRRFVEGGSKPPKDAVRIEELINYFP